MVLTCDICGEIFKDVASLKVHTMIEHDTTLKESTPRTPKEKIRNTVNTEELERKRTELEILKIEKEMTKLTADPEPDTKMDMWKQLLEQQQEHFKQLLEMNKQHNDLRLEIEKLKLGEGGGTDEAMMWLDMLKPVMPVIAEKFLNKGSTPVDSVSSEPTLNIIPASSDNVTRQAKADSVEDKEEELKAAIRNGTVTLKMAWEDFKAQVPDYKKVMTYAQFKDRFNNIKGGV